jgi:hypothetical protein
MRVLSHVGIMGKENADQASNSDLSLTHFTLGILYAYFILFFINKIVDGFWIFFKPTNKAIMR